MPRIRRDVWKLGQQPWDDVILWYARGVAALRERPIARRDSWAFFGAMHGFDEGVWRAFDYLQSGDSLPSGADRSQFWMQCQHQSWYFLPWHRGYVTAFETVLRAAVVELGGPADWALPYWDYSNTTEPHALSLPPAFVEPTLPDGARNPLVERRRYGDGTGRIVIEPPDVALTALREPRFEGSMSGGSTGFGGVRTAFRHSGAQSANSRVERQPHNVVHSLVGGRIPGVNEKDPRSYGLMLMPITAALDPIFWLHHANIDRLWEIWLRRDSTNQNPTAPQWLTGPSDRRFVVPWSDGSTWAFTASEVIDTQAPRLDYAYESLADPFGGTNFVALRLERLGAPATMVAAASERTATETRMMEPRAELMGANQEAVHLAGDAVETRVRIDRAVARRTLLSMRTNPSALTHPTEVVAPDRVFLNLENVRGVNEAAVFYVYVEHADAGLAETLVGVVSLFGVREASAPDGAHAGNGLTESLEISDVVDRLHAAGVEELDDLRVRLVPRTPLSPEDQISVGRISIYREGR
jgi:tyrosinase